jgi:hypothetical protein
LPTQFPYSPSSYPLFFLFLMFFMIWAIVSSKLLSHHVATLTFSFTTFIVGMIFFLLLILLDFFPTIFLSFILPSHFFPYLQCLCFLSLSSFPLYKFMFSSFLLAVTFHKFLVTISLFILFFLTHSLFFYFTYLQQLIFFSSFFI